VIEIQRLASSGFALGEGGWRRSANEQSSRTASVFVQSGTRLFSPEAPENDIHAFLINIDPSKEALRALPVKGAKMSKAAFLLIFGTSCAHKRLNGNPGGTGCSSQQLA
jgi:hypothetical protein